MCYVVYVAPDRLTYETLAISRTLALARAAFAVAIEDKPARPVHDPQPRQAKWKECL
jgi:hypothetical protein